MIRTHKINQVLAESVGSRVKLGGWVQAIKRLGKLSFVELRDASGLIQLTFAAGITSTEAMQLVSELRLEGVILVTGTVRARVIPRERTIDADKQPLEIEVAEATLINQPNSLPFEVAADSEISTTLKLKHRPFYLRRPRLQKNLALRSRAFQFIRQWLVEREFLEIETPILFKTTVGGAREFIVATRNHPGRFYVLRQSPQQLKQILMASGFEKYFQICKLFHDSYPRSQHQPEFTALDLEVAFAVEKDLIELIQGLVYELARSIAPRLNLNQPVLTTYQECMRRFGSDQPDLRFAIEAIRLPDDPVAASRFPYTPNQGEGVYLVRVPRNVVTTCETDVRRLLSSNGIRLIHCIRTGGLSNTTEAAVNPLELNWADWESGWTEVRRGDLLLFAVGQDSVMQAALGECRNWVSQHVSVREWSGELSFLWIVEQPLFKRHLVTGRWKIKHQAFTAPKDPDILNKPDTDPGQIIGREYALICNGAVLGGGSVRIHSAEKQKTVFQLDGLSESEIEFYFGHLLRTLAAGTPPHAGATISLDALVCLLAREQDISEVIPFPKLGNGIDPFTGVPSELSDDMLAKFKLRSL